jgi:aminopeptidase
VCGSDGVQALREYVARDEGAGRLGELALVDSSSRVGQLRRTFGVILLDENTATHIALGFGCPDLVDTSEHDRVNDSQTHLDVTIGSEHLQVTGIDRDGRELPLLRDGSWAL